MVRAGYKQTELGEIPEDWGVKPLGKLLKVKHGKSQKEVIDPDGKYPILATGGEIGRSNVPLYSQPSVLIGRKGTIDTPYYMDTPFWTVDTLFYSEIDQNAYAKFIYYKFLLIDWYQYNEASGVPSLNATTIEKILQIVPDSTDEQKAIAEALTDVDGLIGALEKQIAKKRDIKTATMQQLLTGKKRLPGFGEGKGYKQTELGLIPDDWSLEPLGKLLKIRHGKSQKKVIEPDGKYPILATGGEIGRSNIPLYSRPSVLIGRKGTIDIPYYMDTPFWTVDTLFYSEVADGANAKFLFYKFLFIDWYQYNEASGVPSLNAASIEKILQVVPLDGKEQTAIAEFFSVFDRELESFEIKLSKTKAIKQGMMQELLTGRTRLV